MWPTVEDVVPARCLWPSVQKAAYSSSIIDACHMASLAHAVTSNLFVPQALRSQMQKQRSWWLLRRSYSTSQTRKTFMSNLLCSTPEASHHQALFSVFGHTLCRCSIYIPLCPDRVTSTHPTGSSCEADEHQTVSYFNSCVHYGDVGFSCLVFDCI